MAVAWRAKPPSCNAPGWSSSTWWPKLDEQRGDLVDGGNAGLIDSYVASGCFDHQPDPKLLWSACTTQERAVVRGCPRTARPWKERHTASREGRRRRGTERVITNSANVPDARSPKSGAKDTRPHATVSGRPARRHWPAGGPTRRRRCCGPSGPDRPQRRPPSRPPIPMGCAAHPTDSGSGRTPTVPWSAAGRAPRCSCADRDETSRPEPAHQIGVPVVHESTFDECLDPFVERLPLGVSQQVLHQERDPGERCAYVHHVGIEHGPLEPGMDHGVQQRVQPLDAGDCQFHQLPAEHQPAPHRLGLSRWHPSTPRHRPSHHHIRRHRRRVSGGDRSAGRPGNKQSDLPMQWQVVASTVRSGPGGQGWSAAAGRTLWR